MEPIRKSVLKCLNDFSFNDDKLISELNYLIDQTGNETYPIIFNILTHLDLTPAKADGREESRNLTFDNLLFTST